MQYNQRIHENETGIDDHGIPVFGESVDTIGEIQQCKQEPDNNAPDPCDHRQYSELGQITGGAYCRCSYCKQERAVQQISYLIEDNIRYPFVGELAKRVDESHRCVLRMKSDRSLVA